MTEPTMVIIRNRLGKFAGTSVALDVEIDLAGQPAIKGHIEKLQGLSAEHSPVPLQKSDSILPSLQGSSALTLGQASVINGKKISGPAPVYPESARLRHIQGSVLLGATITEAGTIGTLFPIASADPALTAAAMDAVKRWTHIPYLLNGKATVVSTTVTVNFNLSSGPASSVKR